MVFDSRILIARIEDQILSEAIRAIAPVLTGNGPRHAARWMDQTHYDMYRLRDRAKPSISLVRKDNDFFERVDFHRCPVSYGVRQKSIESPYFWLGFDESACERIIEDSGIADGDAYAVDFPVYGEVPPKIIWTPQLGLYQDDL